MDYLAQIERISRKVKFLREKKETLENENNHLKNEISKLLTTLAEKDSQLHQINQQIQALRLVSSDLSPDEKKDLDKKLNDYIKQIDRCIALLSE